MIVWRSFRACSFGTLEGVAADDGAEAAAVADGASLIEHRFVIILLGAAGEDHDAVTIKGALDNVADALGERSDRDAHLLVDFLGFRLLDDARWAASP